MKPACLSSLMRLPACAQLLPPQGVPPEWIPEVAAQVAPEPSNPAGKRIKVSSLGAPGVVLLGDAAHAVTPVFGQVRIHPSVSIRAWHGAAHAQVAHGSVAGRAFAL